MHRLRGDLALQAGLPLRLAARLLVLLLQKQKLLRLHVLDLRLLLTLPDRVCRSERVRSVCIRGCRHVLHASGRVRHELAGCDLVVLQDLVHQLLLLSARGRRRFRLGRPSALVIDRGHLLLGQETTGLEVEALLHFVCR